MKNNKGFTLVELIVVITILAILAAIAVPSLMSYIDKAKNTKYIMAAESVERATQTMYIELYGKGIKTATVYFEKNNGFKFYNTINNVQIYDSKGKVQNQCSDEQKQIIAGYKSTMVDMLYSEKQNGIGLAESTRFGAPVQIEFDKRGNISDGQITFCPLKSNGTVESVNDGHSVVVKFNKDSGAWEVQE